MFGFGTKTWKDSNDWLLKASELLNNDYIAWFVASSMIFPDSLSFRATSLQEQYEGLLLKSEIVNMYNLKLTDSELDQIQDKVFERLSVMDMTQTSILDFLKNYDDSTIRWLKKNTTNNSEMEDFRKRQLTLMEIINPLLELYVVLKKSTGKFGLDPNADLFKYSWEKIYHTHMDLKKLFSLKEGKKYLNDYEIIKKALL